MLRPSILLRFLSLLVSQVLTLFQKDLPGVHIWCKHSKVTNAAINIERQRAHWTDEEVRMMAHNKACLVMQGTWFINKALVSFHPTRSIEAIKGKRAASASKHLVEQ